MATGDISSTTEADIASVVLPVFPRPYRRNVGLLARSFGDWRETPKFSGSFKGMLLTPLLLILPTRVVLRAGTTLTPPVVGRIPEGVLRCVFVTLGAVRLLCRGSSFGVYGTGHWLQMIRSHTLTIPAQVVEHQFFGNWTDQQLVADAVRPKRLVCAPRANTESTVATTV